MPVLPGGGAYVEAVASLVPEEDARVEPDRKAGPQEHASATMMFFITHSFASAFRLLVQPQTGSTSGQDLPASTDFPYALFE